MIETKETTTGAIVEPCGWLIDYMLINAQDPSLYGNLPAVEALLGLKPGDTVKIGLMPDSQSGNPEHFWVEVAEQRGRGFIGIVQNDIQPTFGVKHGDRLVFCGHHIREIKHG